MQCIQKYGPQYVHAPHVYPQTPKTLSVGYHRGSLIPSALLSSIDQSRCHASPRDTSHARPDTLSLSFIAEVVNGRLLPVGQSRWSQNHEVGSVLLEDLVDFVVVFELMPKAGAGDSKSHEEIDVRVRRADSEGSHRHNLGNAVLLHGGGQVLVRVSHDVSPLLLRARKSDDDCSGDVIWDGENSALDIRRVYWCALDDGEALLGRKRRWVPNQCGNFVAALQGFVEDETTGLAIATNNEDTHIEDALGQDVDFGTSCEGAV